MNVKQYRIKDIAKMAGVSAGTVDRVLHNRGEVSQSSREKVEAILTEIDYKPNLYVSSIGVKRVISIVVVLPSFRRAVIGSRSKRESAMRSTSFPISG